MTVRLRYAPSPTGHLHIGGARTALFNYLYAMHHQGTFILRIEDTDLERNVANAADEFAENLRWLGIEWQEGYQVGGPFGPYTCMERLGIYRDHVDKLVQAGRAYPCFCTEEELTAVREKQQSEGITPHYIGTCRTRSENERALRMERGDAYTIRFQVPEHAVSFVDIVRGEMQFEPEHVGGDFVIVKSNGVPVYNFAVTVDDMLMEITHVIRGEEHISNTPRQLYLYEAFGANPPMFGHVPLILGANGKKLSKRDESIVQFIDQYKALGYLPDAIFNFLALLGWSPGGEREIMTKQELIERFDLERVSKSGAFFDAAKLQWMNGHYLRSADPAALLDQARVTLSGSGVMVPDDAWLRDFLSLVLEKVTQLTEIEGFARSFLAEEVTFDDDAAKTLALPHANTVIEGLLGILGTSCDGTADGFKAVIRRVQEETKLKGKDLFMPIRAALTGTLHGPDLNRSLALIGCERCVKRARQALVKSKSLG
ncbi:glutamate--tRNA ligase [Ferroacidibacillus organovorans]|uniref:Glutamate--tRNA ligase n=2 Tax=Ferroacidibacillus organovorans TaxID=1765683 RepID=A0A101XPB9_9BACL|nr:glutamate--tRNA ligase [Ferroacidibacillus organovorans]